MFKKSTDQQKKPLISIFKNKDVVPSFLPYRNKNNTQIDKNMRKKS